MSSFCQSNQNLEVFMAEDGLSSQQANDSTASSKYFLQVPASTNKYAVSEVTSGFGSLSSKISIGDEALFNEDSVKSSCESLVHQTQNKELLSEKKLFGNECDSKSCCLLDDLINEHLEVLLPSKEMNNKIDELCLSEVNRKRFFYLFQHHYYLMEHLHHCFIRQQRINSSNNKTPSDVDAQRQVESKKSYSLISTNSSGFIDSAQCPENGDEMNYAENFSCDSQFSTVSFPNVAQNSPLHKSSNQCPVCSHKFQSKTLNNSSEVNPFEGPEGASLLKREKSLKKSRLSGYRDEIHPSRLLSTGLNSSSNMMSQQEVNNNYNHYLSSIGRRSKSNILTAVVRPCVKSRPDHSNGMNSFSTGGDQNESLFNQFSNEHDNTIQSPGGNSNGYTSENNDQNMSSDNSSSSQNEGKNSKENVSNPNEEIAMNPISKDNPTSLIGKQGNNSDSVTGLSAAYTDQGTRTCCFCWCCCCSCSCMQMRPNGDKKKGTNSSQNVSNKLDISQGEERPPTYEEVKLWGESFDSLMQNASGQKVFREFLRSEYSDENIMFWLACEDLKQETDSDLVEEKARLIYEDYISILSPKEVSLDSRVREIINGNMIEPSPRTFDEAQLQIYTLMHRDSYPRFLNSKLYKDLIIKTKCDSFE